jgi:hypothetical protein
MKVLIHMATPDIGDRRGMVKMGSDMCGCVAPRDAGGGGISKRSARLEHAPHDWDFSAVFPIVPGDAMRRRD